MTDDASLENLRKFLESDDPALRRMGLSMAKGAGVPEELYKNVFGLSLWDPEEENREAARELVEEIGLENITEFPGWLEPFVKSDVDDSVYDEAVWALGEIGDARAVEPLIEALSVEDWPYYGVSDFDAINPATPPNIECVENVESVVKALGEIGEPSVKPLIKALGDEDANVRWRAALALHKLGWELDTDELRTTYLIALGDWDGCIKLGESTVQPLIKALRDDNWRVARGAAMVLGEIGDARAVEPLTKALSDDEEWVREAAKEALEKLGHEVE